MKSYIEGNVFDLKRMIFSCRLRLLCTNKGYLPAVNLYGLVHIFILFCVVNLERLKQCTTERSRIGHAVIVIIQGFIETYCKATR